MPLKDLPFEKYDELFTTEITEIERADFLWAEQLFTADDKRIIAFHATPIGTVFARLISMGAKLQRSFDESKKLENLYFTVTNLKHPKEGLEILDWFLELEIKKQNELIDFFYNKFFNIIKDSEFQKYTQTPEYILGFLHGIILGKIDSRP